MIGADPGFYLDWTLEEWSGDRSLLADEATREYRRCFDAATIAATCEDYRAGATVDLVDDDTGPDTVVSCPVLVLWSGSGLGDSYDVLGIWRRQAPMFAAGRWIAVTSSRRNDPASTDRPPCPSDRVGS